MYRLVMALSATLTGFWLLVGTPAPAEASPACEHRSAAHVAEHGGLQADNAWHVSHGQLPTCDNEPKHDDPPREHHDDDRKDDDGGIPHRDHVGFHCKWLVFCG